MNRLFALVCLLLLCPGRAHAQALTDSLLPALRVVEVPAPGPVLERRVFPFAAALQLEPALPDRASLARQHTARQILAGGIGFALAAAIAPTYIMPNRFRCWTTGKRSGGPPLKAAAVMGAIGIGMAIGGGAWLGVEARRHGYHASRRERLIAMGVGALTFTLGQAALVPVFIADQICHS